MRKILATFTAFAMCLSLLSGFAVRPKAAGTVNVELPKTTGIYLAEYINIEYNEALGKDVTHEGVDSYGNVILLNGGNEAIRWREQDNPWYFNEEELNNGKGPNVSPSDSFWFDYVDGTKVTHLSVKDLTFTHIDGTAYPEVTAVANNDDSRIISFKTTKLDPVLVTYKAGKTNNKMVICPQLDANFYSSSERSIDSYVSDNHINVIKGKTKDIWLHLCDDSWDEARFEMNPDEFDIFFWEDNNVPASDVLSVEPVSIDNPKNLIYKITLKGNQDISGYQLSFNYKKYDINNPNDEWDEGRFIEVNIVEGNTLLTCGDQNLNVKGKQYSIKDSNRYEEEAWISTYGNVPIYTALRFIDGNGQSFDISNPSDIKFYQQNWNDSVEDFVTDTTPSETPVTITHVGDTNLLEFTPNGKGGGNYAIGYKDNAPSGKIVFLLGDDSGINDGFFTSNAASSKTYVKDAVSTGLSDTTIYFGVSSQDDWVKSCKTDKITLIDENGNDLSANVKNTDGAAMTFPNNFTATYSNKIVIPKRTIKSSAILSLNYSATMGDGNVEARTAKFYVFYNPVGATFTVSNVTYVVNDFDSVAVKSVKNTLKKVTIPATVNEFKVNAIEAKAMNGCKKLKTITVKSTAIKAVGTNAFKGVKKSATIKVPKANLKAYKNLFKKGGFKGKVK